ncbi:MAG: hypothetical protein GY898_30800 [Proteobacteria bacterium]|nr:hypothetical protein [Pseudomonadota bacterium]
MKALQLLASGLALGLLGCPTVGPEPPDPNEPVPPVTCADDGAPLSLTRVTADSLKDAPGWIQICTLCPATSIELAADVPLFGAWTGTFGCAVAFPADVPPEETTLAVDVTVHDGERIGEATIEVAMPERGENPEDLGSATYRIDLAAEGAYRVPSSPLASALTPGDELPELLVHLGEPDLDGGRVVTVGLTEVGETTQDLCQPTEQWALPATLDRRHLIAPLAAGDRLPAPFGAIVEGGIFQAEMRASGAAFNSGSILARIDLAASEAEFGMAPDELCDVFTSFFGTGICVPCADPSEGTAGLPTCVTTVQEFELAPATNEPLIPVSAADLPPECSEA